MPDMSGEFKKAGFRPGSSEKKCRECGRPFIPREPHHTLCANCVKQNVAGLGAPQGTGGWRFPEGYPDYFDSDGILRSEFVTSLAESIAGELGRVRPKMTMNQLRAFYHHAKLQEGAIERGRPFREVWVEISKLKAFARERASKEKIPRFFEQFISRNVDRAKDDKTFSEGFMEHFQAVVAYSAGTLKER